MRVQCSKCMNEIIKAWVIEGNNPTYHRYQQERLKKEWPALYKAITKNL